MRHAFPIGKALLAYAMEIGRFGHGERCFRGVLDGNRVIQQPDSDDAPIDTSGRVWDYGDLVVFSPIRPTQIVDIQVGAEDPKVRLRPSSSVGPHRAMVTVPRDRRAVVAMPRLGCLLRKPLFKASLQSVRDAIQGCLTAIIFEEESPFPSDPASLASLAHEGFTTLGAALTLAIPLPSIPPVLWHNGRALAGSAPQSDPHALIAGVSAWLHLGAGDLILTGPAPVTRIRAGDHLECRCPPLRPSAVNIGFRGSA